MDCFIIQLILLTLAAAFIAFTIWNKIRDID
jgi:hypothetical protein